VLETGEAQCWGGNSEGQLGNGDRSYRTSPVAVIDLKATPTPVPTPPLTPPAAAPGDANCDHSVTSIDAALVLQLSAGLIGSLQCQTAADVNHSGSVNSIDAALILQYAAGLIHNLRQ